MLIDSSRAWGSYSPPAARDWGYDRETLRLYRVKALLPAIAGCLIQALALISCGPVDGTDALPPELQSRVVWASDGVELDPPSGFVHPGIGAADALADCAKLDECRRSQASKKVELAEYTNDVGSATPHPRYHHALVWAVIWVDTCLRYDGYLPVGSRGTPRDCTWFAVFDAGTGSYLASLQSRYSLP